MSRLLTFWSAVSILVSGSILTVDCLPPESSHVLQFGDAKIGKQHLDFFMGDTSAPNEADSNKLSDEPSQVGRHVDQRNADLVYLEAKVRRAEPGSKEAVKAQINLDRVKASRMRLDSVFESILEQLFKKDVKLLNVVRPAHLQVVDDWDCLRNMIDIFNKHCGPLGQYGMKHTRTLANICNARVDKAQMEQVCESICSSKSKQ